jgi:hypothetical protein
MDGTLSSKIKENSEPFSNLLYFLRPVQGHLEHAEKGYSTVDTEEAQTAGDYCSKAAERLKEVNETLAQVFNGASPSERDDLSALTEGFNPLSLDEI